MKKIALLIIGCILLDLFSLSGIHSNSFMRHKLTSSFVSLPYGSGSVINCKNGIVYILTARHVLNQNKSMLVKFPQIDFRGKQTSFFYERANVVFQNEAFDVAILEVKTKKYLSSVVVNTDPLKILDQVYEIGIPNRTTLWVTSGQIACLDVSSGNFGHNTPTYLGNSGGPTFNSNGEQIGLVIAIGLDIYLNPIPHIAQSVSIKTVKELLGEKDFKKYFRG